MGETVDQTPYWYERESVEREVLESVRRFRRADNAMRDRAADDMDMGVNDMRALQIVIAAWRCGMACTPMYLSRELGITTASTAKLLNRLTASGHLRRVPNNSDGRSTLIEPTEHAHTEVRQRMAIMHTRMREVVMRFSPDELRAVSRFLGDMADVFDTSDQIAPLVPAPEAPLSSAPSVPSPPIVVSVFDEDASAPH